MDRIYQLKEVTKNLTVLYAEDDVLSRTIVENKLKTLFKNIVLAEDGQEALERFGQNSIDIVLTDNLMPKMNGLDFIKEIRKTDIKTPIILITAHMDTEFLIKAINLGVTQFVAKPVSFDNLTHAIEISVQRVVIENLALKATEQELELLRYREKYHSTQQERAFRKELNIIKNDLHMKKIDTVNETGKKTSWFVSLYYKPLDILSGDSYSIRKISPGKILLFLVDAMGKGLSASVTTILSTSFVNHLIDNAVTKKDFHFAGFVAAYTKFIQKELLDDEIVCASFIFIDLKQETMETAIFSMPPVIIQTNDNRIIKIKSNNLPIMKYININQIDSHDLSGAKKVLVYSDGLNESINKDCMYEESLIADFRASSNKNELYLRFHDKIRQPDDDVTFLFLKRIDDVPSWEKTYTINTKLHELSRISNEIEDVLSSFDAHHDFIITFINSLTEILMNAYEHGNLSIDSQLKNMLLRDGDYEDYLLNAENEVNKKITIVLSLFTDEGKEFLMLRVADEGRGFDTNSLIENSSEDQRLNGRGIKIAQSFVDELYYNKTGNEVTLIRQLTRLP